MGSTESASAMESPMANHPIAAMLVAAISPFTYHVRRSRMRAKMAKAVVDHGYLAILVMLGFRKMRKFLHQNRMRLLFFLIIS